MYHKEMKLRNDVSLAIREAKSEDAPHTVDYLEHIAGETPYLAFGPGEWNRSVADEEKLIKDYLDSSNQIFLMAEIDSQVVGCLTFRAIDRPRIRHTGTLGLSVAKKYWGLGIGAYLVESLFEWAKMTGIVRKINLRVRTDNARAVALFKRLGFIEEGLISREVFTSGRFYDCISMGMQID